MILRGGSISSSESFDFFDTIRRADADDSLFVFLLDRFLGESSFSASGGASTGCCVSSALREAGALSSAVLVPSPAANPAAF